MMRIQFVVTKCWFAILGLTISVATAAAQSSKLPNPADPGAAAPATKYETPFSDYRPFREEKIRSWQEVNKEVADNPGMGSMKHTPGMTMPGMDAKASDAPNIKGSAAGHNMDSMKDTPGKPMPGMDKQAATASKGKEGAAGHNMDAMKDMPGKPMSGMDNQAATAPKGKEGAAGHNMGAMKVMPGKPTSGKDEQAATASKGKDGATGHNMGSMKDMPGKPMPGVDKQAAAAPMSKDGHGMMAMAKPQTGPGNAQTADITGTGVVQGIDKANGKVRLTHDPIAALGWPKMTLFFRLKDSALADQVKEGDKVEFSLEKSASGYVISSFQKGAASHDMKQMK